MHPMYKGMYEVSWCMVVWCRQNAPRRQQFHVAPAMSMLKYTTLVDIKKRAIKS